jgi:hypothetical protein
VEAIGCGVVRAVCLRESKLRAGVENDARITDADVAHYRRYDGNRRRYQSRPLQPHPPLLSLSISLSLPPSYMGEGAGRDKAQGAFLDQIFFQQSLPLNPDLSPISYPPPLSSIPNPLTSKPLHMEQGSAWGGV